MSENNDQKQEVTEGLPSLKMQRKRCMKRRYWTLRPTP